MNAWSRQSTINLDSCHVDLKRLFDRVLKIQDCTVLCGFRGPEEQREAFRTGHSKLDWPESLHNCRNVTPLERGVDPNTGSWAEDVIGLGRSTVTPRSHAVDVVPYPIDWTDRYRFAWFAGTVRGVASELRIPVYWGGNWDGGDLERQSFDDLVHFEIR